MELKDIKSQKPQRRIYLNIQVNLGYHRKKGILPPGKAKIRV
jgi:hypothetical protein